MPYLLSSLRITVVISCSDKDHIFDQVSCAVFSPAKEVSWNWSGSCQESLKSRESSCCLFFRDGNLLKTDLLLSVRTTQTGWQIQGCARGKAVPFFPALMLYINVSLPLCLSFSLFLSVLQAHASTSTINKYPFLSSVAPLHLQRKHSGGCVFHANTVECSTYLLQS